MLARLHRYLLIALLLVIPVQGMAAVVHSFACGPDASAAAAAAKDSSHKHDHMAAADHDHGAAHRHDHQSGKGTGDSAQHQCCHQVSAAPIVYIPPAQADLPVYVSFEPVLELTFVLEQPQRPPRA